MSDDQDDRSDDELDEFEQEWIDDNAPCHDCHGEGMVVSDWGMRQHPIDSGASGEIVKCRNCGGSGLRKDCTVF